MGALSPRRADPSSPRSSQATASVPLHPLPPPLASPDTPCSYSLLVMAACVYGCTAYIPQLGALRPRRADPSSSRSSQARRADLSSPPSSQAPALSPSLLPPQTTSPIHRRAALYRRVRRLLAAPTRHRLAPARQLHLSPSPLPATLSLTPPPHPPPTLGARGPFCSPRRVC